MKGVAGSVGASDVVVQAPVGILVVSFDPPGRAVLSFVNPQAARLVGRTTEELTGEAVTALVVDDDWRLLSERMAIERDERSPVPCLEGELICADGRRRPVSFLWRPLGAPSPPVLSESSSSAPLRHFVVAVVDEAHHRQVAEQLRHQALHDPLTGLANRILVVEHLEQALAEGRRLGVPVALAYLDVDDLKAVNEGLGHSAGDELLITLGQRLQRALRSTDVAGRVGGDEFVVVSPDASDEHELRHLGERIRSSVAGPVLLAGRPHRLSVSVGVATGGPMPVEAVTVMNRADEALRRAKRQGKDQVTYYDQALDAEVREERILDAELRRAIAVDELRLAFQPIIDLRSGRVEGMEALVRWQHPRRGLLPPHAFLSVAEESGAIVALGQWVLDAGCAELRRLLEDRPGLVMSVNVSAAQLGRTDLVPAVKAALDRNELSQRSLRVELTETAMTESPSSLEELWELDRMGVRVGIDDFGTGYGSLTYLQSLPARFLKIDRSFVDDILENESHLAIVRAVIDLATTLDIAVVAEGVETSRQATLLRELGCPSGQGYLFSPPMLAVRFEEYLAVRG